MEGLEEKLQNILSDPNSMAQIMSMAQAMGQSQLEQPPKEPPKQEPASQMNVGGLDLGMIQRISSIARPPLLRKAMSSRMWRVPRSVGASGKKA